MTRPTAPTYVVELVPTPAGRDACGADPIGRLRLILKRLLRRYGYRCTSVTEQKKARPLA